MKTFKCGNKRYKYEECGRFDKILMMAKGAVGAAALYAGIWSMAAIGSMI